MKKSLAVILAAALLSAALASCAVSPRSASSSSDAAIASARAWLAERLGDDAPASLAVDTADASEKYGVDMSGYEDDGFFIRADGGDVVILAKTDAALDRAVRNYANHGNADSYAFSYHEGYRVKKLTVCGEDISAFAVVTDDDANDNQLFAASELAKYVEKACGVRLASYTAGEYAALGGGAPKAIRLTVDYPALGDEAFRITVAEGAVTVEGGRYRGCLYGVYDLLEDIGWRFVFGPVSDSADDVIEYLYESEHVDLTSDLDREESASFTYRTVWRGKNSSDDIGVKFRDVSHYADPASPAAAKYGNYGLTGIACHGLHANGWLAQMVDEGLYSGNYDSDQPCFTDPEVIDFVTGKALEYVAVRLNAGQQIGREIVTVDIAQADNSSFCRCKRCQEAIRIDGSDSGPQLRFANAVAAALDDEYPGVFVSILSYSGTNIPPKVTKPLDNVRISYCIYIGQGRFTCSAHSVSGEDCDPAGGVGNLKFGNELAGWAEICSNNNLDVWYYPFDCYCMGFDSPITDQIYESMTWLASLGCVSGMMYHSGLSTGTTLQGLNAYLGTKLLWDAEMTKDEYDALIREWFMIVYGESADYIYPYFKQCVVAGKQTGCWCSFYSNNTSKVDNDYMAEHFDKWWDDFGLALAKAESAKQYEWIERYMGGMLYMCCGLTYEDRCKGGDEASRAAYLERYELLHTLFRKYRIAIYDSLVTYELIPEEFDPEISPFDWAKDGRV